VTAIPGRDVLYVGLDLSLTSTGAGMIHRGVGWALQLRPPRAAGTGPGRLEWLAANVVRCCQGAAVIVCEGPSYGSAQGAYKLGGLFGVIELELHRAGLPPPVLVSPATLKVYATGYGGSRQRPVTKAMVLAAMRITYPRVNFDGHDAADGFGLAAMAAHHYGAPLASVPAVQARALASVDWPPLLAAA
jgi:Holliday junction resolvasome RuvABC endonuclease subunit